MSELSEFESLGKFLAARRQELNLTQGELGAKLGVSQMMVSQLECDRKRLPPKHLKKLAGILGTALSNLEGLRMKPIRSSPESADLSIAIDFVLLRTLSEVAFEDRGTKITVADVLYVASVQRIHTSSLTPDQIREYLKLRRAV